MVKYPGKYFPGIRGNEALARGLSMSFSEFLLMTGHFHTYL